MNSTMLETGLFRAVGVNAGNVFGYCVTLFELDRMSARPPSGCSAFIR
jgi:hypothetical protein